jgi:hypothetical protein
MNAMRDVMLVIHWRGGQHSELRVRKPAPGEHTKRASADADRVIREMATRWSDTHIAATLNRMGSATGYGNTWTHARVGSYRRKAGIHGYESAVKDGRCLTMLDAANMLGVSCHVIRKLIRDGVLPARQVMFDAPGQIGATDPDVDAGQAQHQACTYGGARPGGRLFDRAGLSHHGREVRIRSRISILV